MKATLFPKWVSEQDLKAFVLGTVKKLNDSKKPLTYRFKSMLRPQFSLSGKWESLLSSNSLVAADLVAMDSSLPLKMRDKMGSASGDIPKLGIEFALNETQLTNLQTLIASGGNKAQIIADIYKDTPRVIGGMYERLEMMFLEGLSTGVTLVEDADNVGTGVRVDYGYLTENKFGVSKVWSDTTSTPVTDFVNTVKKKATEDGNTPSIAMTDSVTIDHILATAQARQLYGFQIGFAGDKENIPTPTLEQFNVALKARHGFVLDSVDRAMKVEKNGKRKTVRPWKEGSVIFLTDTQVGTLDWARLAEMGAPVEGVNYQTVESYILVSKFSTNRPKLSEFTNGQARVVPVISNVDEIYMIDSTTVQA